MCELFEFGTQYALNFLLSNGIIAAIRCAISIELSKFLLSRERREINYLILKTNIMM